MRQLMVAVALLAAGCLVPSGVVYEDPPPGPTPAELLQEILDWAAADGSATALDAKQAAQAVLHRPSDSEAYKDKISRAWTQAQAATKPGLQTGKKKRLWAACISELTHGPDG